MAKTRLTEPQVLKVLQEVANGAKPTDLAKKHGFSLGSFYNWKSRYGIPTKGGAAPEAKAAPAAKASPAKKKAGRPAKKKAGRPAKKAVATTAATPAKKKA